MTMFASRSAARKALIARVRRDRNQIEGFYLRLVEELLVAEQPERLE
jgi:hypothetical protein